MKKTKRRQTAAAGRFKPLDLGLEPLLIALPELRIPEVNLELPKFTLPDPPKINLELPAFNFGPRLQLSLPGFDIGPPVLPARPRRSASGSISAKGRRPARRV